MIKIGASTASFDALRPTVEPLVRKKLSPLRSWLWLPTTNEERVAMSTLAVWCALDPPQRPSATAPSDLKDVYLREFPRVDDLVDALVGHVRAQPARDAEETLAYRVLGNLRCYEALALDPALLQLLTLVQQQGLLGRFYQAVNLKSFYGYGARLPAGDDAAAILAATNALPELERLYIKVATIHHVGRYCGSALGITSTPGRNDHAAMRAGKFGLDESHAMVRSDRAAGVSIWAGTSGSAMDMLHIVQSLGLAQQGRLEAIAWCIFAFFHFMPTVASPTHTFHEVMRGALRILGTMQSYAGATAIPGSDYAVQMRLPGAQ